MWTIPGPFPLGLTCLQTLSRKILSFSRSIPARRRQIESLGYAPNADFHFWLSRWITGFALLQKQSKLVLTDSGSIQEETSLSGYPLPDAAKNTERPVTVELGTSRPL